VKQSAGQDEVRAGNVDDDARETDAEEEERLVAFHDREEDHDSPHHNHQQITPPKMADTSLAG